MKIVRKFETSDGQQFDTLSAAEDYEALQALCAEAMQPLGDVPDDVKNGKGWVQHDLETVNCCKDAILELCRRQRYDIHYPAFRSAGRACHPLSIIGRVLNDSGGPLDKAWSRFSRIDAKGREHQQCYFAYTGGPDSRHVCIEDRSAQQEEARRKEEALA